MPLDKTIAKAEAEVSANRLWRAREILHSSIRQYGYEPNLFRKLADVLMLMCDAPAAGKYLFLTVDEPTEQQAEAIEVFLSRSAKQGYEGLLKSLPKRARLPRIDDYPKFAQATLRRLKAPEVLPGSATVSDQPSSIIGGIGCFVVGTLVVLFFAICFLVGLVQVAAWLFTP